MTGDVDGTADRRAAVAGDEIETAIAVAVGAEGLPAKIGGDEDAFWSRSRVGITPRTDIQKPLSPAGLCTRDIRMDSPRDSGEELHREVRRLRTEIQQLREIVNALFNAVFEDSDEEFDSTPKGDDNNMYN